VALVNLARHRYKTELRASGYRPVYGFHDMAPAVKVIAVGKRENCQVYLEMSAGRHRRERDRGSRPATSRPEDRGSGDPGRKVAAWRKDRNGAKVDWRFKSDKAQIRLKFLYPDIQCCRHASGMLGSYDNIHA